MRELYQAVLMDHYRTSPSRGTLENPDFSSGVVNPSCGDAITIEGNVANDAIVTMRFQGTGCVISQATASLLCEKVMGKKIDVAQGFTKDDILRLVGIPVGPTRLRCALLSLEALHKGLNEYAQSCKGS